MTDLTPGWRFLWIGIEGDPVSIGGTRLWETGWSPQSVPPITVAHPSYPKQRHQMFVYQMNTDEGVRTFADGEFSNGVWGIFVPDSQ